jgi:hypothetical protein
VQCTPRRAPDRLFLFVENDQATPSPVNLRLRSDDDGARFGIDPARRYVVRDDLNDRPLATVTGAELLRDGVAVDVGAMGTAVVVITPA